MGDQLSKVRDAIVRMTKAIAAAISPIRKAVSAYRSDPVDGKRRMFTPLPIFDVD